MRGVCYHLFVKGIIPSMARKETARVSRLLKDAREEGTIPWKWVVDETRELKRTPSWSSPSEFVGAVRESYRRDFWHEQPNQVEVWSEKGTVRGILGPVLDEYGVGFRVRHGFGSATSAHDVAQDWYRCPLTVLYMGDWDPSGMYMSEEDLPNRLWRYGGDHVTVERAALVFEDLEGLPSFPATETDPRYRWFAEHYGPRAWELDAMNPNDLRERVCDAIVAEIEPEAWRRCELAQEAVLRYLVDAFSYAEGKFKWIDAHHNLSAVDLPKPKSESRPYTIAEVKKLLPALEEVDPRAGWIGHVAFQTGRRLTAIRTLPKSAVQLHGDHAVLEFPSDTDKARNTGLAVVAGDALPLTRELMRTHGRFVTGTTEPRSQVCNDWLQEAEALAGIPHRKGRAGHGLKRLYATMAPGMVGREKQSGTTGQTLDRVYVQDELGPKIDVARSLAERLG